MTNSFARGSKDKTFLDSYSYYNHQDADRDLNVIFPHVHFRDLVRMNVVGSLAPRHFGFMGHIEGEQLSRLKQQRAPEVAEKLRTDEVDFVFLTPA